MQSCKTALTITLALLISLSASAARAVTLGQIDDFQDGTVQNWGEDFTAFNFNVPDAGPGGVGDNALHVDGNDSTVTPRVLTFNQTQWTGDFTTAGITQISMDVRNQYDFDLELRLGIANGSFQALGVGDTYVSAESVNVPSDGAWHSIVLPILATDFEPTFVNTADPPDAGVALTNVTHFRILHNTVATEFRGAMGSGEFFLDNIRAISGSGDFDNDGDVDGADFLRWQRNTNVGNLSAWEENFGNTGALEAAHAVPEPTTGLLLLLAAVSGLLLRKPRFAK